ncbi:MAG: XRE family transcriptional regulator [Gammaproteobacteria bacterium]|nr:XRE family transcriptional regulator [Gammaproteobacteria bacterium]
MGNQVKITPKVLLWARETAGMSPEDVAGRLKVKSVTAKTIAKWESGGGAPTYPQLRKMAEMYRRPIAVFFFPSPPQEPELKKKFRSLPAAYADKIPARMRFFVRDGLAMQINLHELFDGVNPSEKKILKNIQVGDSVSAVVLAARVREYLGVSLKTQFNWEDEDVALKAWRATLEESGLWVFKDAFHEDNYCGFCLHDERFPVIYVNNSMPKVRQIFTLFHELAHLIRGKGGIDMRQFAVPELTGPYRREEVFCNAFAGAMLVPHRGFPGNEHSPDNRRVKMLAKRYKVSREVILRRYLDKKLVSREEYESRVMRWNKEFARIQKQPQKPGGDYYATRRAYLGQKYLDIAFQRYHQQRISEYQLADYLGVKTKSLSAFQSYMLGG